MSDPTDSFFGMTQTDWHPWRYVAERFPDVIVITTYRLPGRMMGHLRGNMMWICSSLNQAERRSTLTHELQHLERGTVPTYLAPREERIVSDLSARALITLPRLVDAMRWTQDLYELAEELWTDVPTVQCRLDYLDPLEVAEIEHQLGDDWLPCIA